MKFGQDTLEVKKMEKSNSSLNYSCLCLELDSVHVQNLLALQLIRGSYSGQPIVFIHGYVLSWTVPGRVEALGSPPYLPPTTP